MQQNKNTVLGRRALKLAGAFQADDFGTPISIAAGGVGRPIAGSTGQTVVPDRIDV